MRMKCCPRQMTFRGTMLSGGRDGVSCSSHLARCRQPGSDKLLHWPCPDVAGWHIPMRQALGSGILCSWINSMNSVAWRWNEYCYPTQHLEAFVPKSGGTCPFPSSSEFLVSYGTRRVWQMKKRLQGCAKRIRVQRAT